ncbi:RRM domain-containing protein [Meloidogyne graminicola]|uniref:RRM domain-containing protein n=1 Tax=Meloidogyne graminicola TaxID=189291 RepID=A0A8S9Z6F5_9BILA|nr:RRM domain-containing protein [Meloidogyne graminicola]
MTTNLRSCSKPASYFLNFRTFATKDFTRVYLDLLPENITKTELEMFLFGHGKVHNIKIKGSSASVDFEIKEEAIQAVDALTGRNIDGHTVVVRLARRDLRIGSTDWEKEGKQFIHYTPESLLFSSDYYYYKTPKDLLQAAEKCWFAGSFTVKIVALENGISIESHREIGKFWKFLVPKLPLKMSTGYDLGLGFISAEQLHKYVYGVYLPLEEFEEHRENVKKMIFAAKEIDNGVVRKVLEESKFVQDCKESLKNISLFILYDKVLYWMVKDDQSVDQHDVLELSNGDDPVVYKEEQKEITLVHG